MEYPKLYLYRRIVQAKLFIDSHYAGDIDLEQIADEAYFSKFHFCRLFKTYSRLSFYYSRDDLFCIGKKRNKPFIT